MIHGTYQPVHVGKELQRLPIGIGAAAVGAQGQAAPIAIVNMVSVNLVGTAFMKVERS